VTVVDVDVHCVLGWNFGRTGSTL